MIATAQIEANKDFRRTFSSLPGDVLAVLESQSQLPPGQDMVIGSFYKAVLTDYRSRGALSKLMVSVTRERQMTPELFVNLLFRAFQFHLTENLAHKDYPIGLEDEKSWSNILDSVMNSPDGRRKIHDILTTEHTTTTIYERYAGPMAVAVALFGSRKDVAWVDLGCGGGTGSLGGIQGISFSPISDETPENYFTSQISKFNRGEFALGAAIGVDQYDPRDPKAQRWRWACQYYPKEWGKREKQIELDKRLLEADQVTFAIGDFTSGTYNYSDGHNGQIHIAPGTQDLVVLNTVLYMHQSTEKQNGILTYAHSLLSPTGIIVLSEFATKTTDKTRLNFKVDWGEKFTYRTFVTGNLTDNKLWEIFKWDNGRCKIVQPGEDLSKFIKSSDSVRIPLAS